MPIYIKELLDAIAAMDSLKIAIIFIGLISLGVIWLASIVLKRNSVK